MTRPVTEVAVGVLIRADGAVLLADRPAGKPYAGYWEFPGGKLEPGESVAGALARELHEELGVAIGAACPWATFEFDYPHAYVRLHFCRVFDWQGTPHAREGQRMDFFGPADALPAPLLPAAVPALRWLALQALYALTAAGQYGRDGFLARLELALARGLRLVQLREPTLADDEVARLLPDVRARVHAYGGKLLVGSRHSRALWDEADGVHLTAAALAATAQRPSVGWVGASVHRREELVRAGKLGCDFAALGPVLPTASHPGAPTLGWREFERLALDAPLPVYALGGLTAADVEVARRAGAQGVAMLSAAWPGQ
ncbi:MAG: Nudix family hydrolase [Burkholderiales bacterium]|jgi:8-oxo-dGTP diphosphatase|nr:Nudix family hydrolase [Burkholderiales bacterium]